MRRARLTAPALAAVLAAVPMTAAPPRNTGGILQDDWSSVDQDKYAYLEPYPLPPGAGA